MRILVALSIFSMSQLCLAGQGFIEKEGVRMNVVETFASLDKSKGKLTIYLLPSKIPAADRREVLEKNAFFYFVSKPSPDSKKWSWYPYAKLELSSNKAKLKTQADLTNYYLMAYGIKKKNDTDNLNGGFKYEKNTALINYKFDGKRVSFQFRGKNDFFKINWQLNVDAEVQ